MSEPEDTYPNAGRESGYIAPVGEDLVNKLTIMLAGPQTKLVQLTAQLDASVKVQDQRFDYVLRQLSAHLDKEDARHDAYDRAEQSTLQALTSVAHRLDEITAYVQQSVTIAREALTVSKAGAARLGKLEKNLRALDTRHGGQIKALLADIAAIKQVIAARPAERAADQKRLEERLGAMEKRLATLEAHGDAG